jgi:hypothetical protein
MPTQSPGPAQKKSLMKRIGSSVRPKKAPLLRSANPGLDLMGAVDLIRDDFSQHLPHDPHMKRLLIRHDALLREGEGYMASKDAEDIDAYIAEQIVRYAQLRRKESRERGFRISSASAFLAIEYMPDRTSAAVINFSITGAGHSARGSVRIIIS